MHSDGIWTDLKLQRKRKTIYLKHAFWRYWKRFGTEEKTLKTRTVNDAFWRLTIVGTILNFREIMKRMSLKHALWRNVKRLGTAEKMKTRTVNDAFWRYLKRFETFMSRLVGAHPSPHWLSFFISFLDILFFWLSRKNCRLGPTRSTRSYASAWHSKNPGISLKLYRAYVYS